MRCTWCLTCKDLTHIGLDVLFKDETGCMTDEWHAHFLVSSLISFILNEHNLSTSTSDPSQVTSAYRLYVYFSTYLLLRTWMQSSLFLWFTTVTAVFQFQDTSEDNLRRKLCKRSERREARSWQLCQHHPRQKNDKVS